MEDLQEDTMGNQYRIATSKSGANDDENEVGLFGVDNNSKTRCYNCQQFGHRSYDCKNATVERTDNGGGGNKKNKGKKKGKCSTCGKQGHSQEDCWIDPKNSAKVPAWMKKKMEKKGSGETEMGAVEVLLSATCVSEHSEVSLLEDEDECNGWIVNDDVWRPGWVETALMGVMMMFPMVLKFLEQANVWVGDTASSIM
jgi:hypothetical protein